MQRVTLSGLILLVGVPVAAAQAPAARDSPAVGAAAPESASRQRVSVGYYASFAGSPVDQIPWRRLTHVCHAYLRTDEAGELVTDKAMPSRVLTDAAHARGVKVLLSLGGGRTSAGLERVTADRPAITRYVTRVVKMVAENGYDGVDIAWEFPRNRETRAGFVDLVAALRRALDIQAQRRERSEPFLLTAAVSPSGFFGKWIDVGAVIKRLDWLHVMTYDMAGPWSRTAGHHAPLFPSPADPERGWRSVSIAMNYWHKDRGVPRQKLVLGIPLYGRAYPVTRRFAELDPELRKQHGTLTFAQVRTLVGRGWPADWDDQSKAPWLQTPDGKRLIIAYDDRNSVDQKAKWAKAEGYLGLFFYAIHQDRMSDGTHWLIRAADRAWPLEK
ncbi:MAG: glycoside hydrolase family 18 protein [Planctomycetota bacterium]